MKKASFDINYMESMEYQQLMVRKIEQYNHVEYRELNNDEFPIVGTLEAVKVA